MFFRAPSEQNLYIITKTVVVTFFIYFNFFLFGFLVFYSHVSMCNGLYGLLSKNIHHETSQTQKKTIIHQNTEQTLTGRFNWFSRVERIDVNNKITFFMRTRVRVILVNMPVLYGLFLET